MPTSLLENKTILVTRPQHQADNLCQLIEEKGGNAFRFPTIEINPVNSSADINSKINQLAEYNILLFISPNAVNMAMPLLPDQTDLPNNIKIGVVGPSSAKALKQFGYKVDFFPAQKADSEHLLELEDLKSVAGKRILIFRGNGGRELLAETLTQRGAIVEYVEVYSRSKPHTDPTSLNEALVNKSIDISLATSRQGLENLYEMTSTEAKPYLLNIPLVIVSQRMIKLAQQLGFTAPLEIAEKPHDEAIMETIENFFLKS